MKYFVVSLHRCGTHSTASYLEELGILTRHWPVDHEGVDLQEMVRGRESDLAHVTDVLAPVIDSYQVVADVPIPALYRELFARYPEARFLLYAPDTGPRLAAFLGAEATRPLPKSLPPRDGQPRQGNR